jgi:hypothetical protein
MSWQSGDDGALLFYVGTQRNYARADFDRTLNFVQSYIYALPFGKGKAYFASGLGSKILGGWSASGILSLRSGSPLTITANGGTLNLPSSTQTADQVKPVEILHGINVGNPWFDTSAFVQPVGARFGTSGRNTISGPGTYGLNAKLGRTFTLAERKQVEVRAESLNVTNTPQFANPANSITSATYGMITATRSTGTGVNGTGGGRVVQFAAKFTF